MTIFLNITMSLDGFVAGPNQTLEDARRGRRAVARVGRRARELACATRARGRRVERGRRSPPRDARADWRVRHGPAHVQRRLGPWEDDPKGNGWWGDDPPFDGPVYVVTHHAREPLVLGSTTFTFVNGIEEAIRQAREAAGDRDVQISGGASVAQQALNAGLLDELHIHVAPQVLGGGVRLFESADPGALELVRAVESPYVAHLTYRVRQPGGAIVRMRPPSPPE